MHTCDMTLIGRDSRPLVCVLFLAFQNTFNYASITAVTLDTLRPGHSVTLEPKDGQWTIQPGNLAVLELHQARNGVLLILDGMIDVD